jgi:hypothetical protein
VSAMTKDEISAYMRDIGRKGGRIGGKRRLATMTPEERSACARHAAIARWGRQDGWSRETWPVGTRFKYRFALPDEQITWDGCVVVRYTAARVYWRYPPYDGDGSTGLRRTSIAEFSVAIANRKIVKES